MSPEEVQEFIGSTTPIMEKTDSKFSYKSNLYIIKRNFDKIYLRMKAMFEFCVYLYNMIDIESITENVIEYLGTSKKMLEIDYNLNEGETVVQDGFNIARLQNNQVNISRQASPDTWNVERLMVTVKNVDGHILYPTIITKNNKIELYFLDGISSNYKVFFI